MSDETEIGGSMVEEYDSIRGLPKIAEAGDRALVPKLSQTVLYYSVIFCPWHNNLEYNYGTTQIAPPVVTGQVGKAPCVHVWDAETAEQRCTFKLKEGSRGVSGISISPCQRYVACVDLHNDHHVVIYNIKRAKQLLHIEGSKETILQVAWSKKADDLRFVTVGLKELKFWNPADATKRLSTKGTFGTKGAITNFLGAAFDSEGNCFTAGANGSIYVWDSNAQLDKVHKGHSAEISAIAHEGGKLFTGGKDKKILVHSTKNTL